MPFWRNFRNGIAVETEELYREKAETKDNKNNKKYINVIVGM